MKLEKERREEVEDQEELGWRESEDMRLHIGKMVNRIVILIKYKNRQR